MPKSPSSPSLPADGANVLGGSKEGIVPATPADGHQAGPAIAPQADPSRYTYKESLGKGGLAEVFKVTDARDGSVRALKRLHRGDLPGAISLFEREYHTLKQLAHPSIIEVYDYGLDALDRPYYTMELLSGHDLRELAPLPWEEACRVLLPVASSLAVLHSRRLLHRDVSARNVRRTAEGEAKLIDFGCMCEMGAPPETVGTPPYMPPEAVHGQPLDGRADLFAFGALAYFVLTGRHAYPARNLRELVDRWRSRPKTPRQISEHVPEPLDHLVMSLLRLDAQVRPANAAEVMTKLSGIAGLPLDEAHAVQRAYLTTPKLVGRAKHLLAVRKQIIRALRSRGGTLLVKADPGMGRSRMLDAALLEAKMANCVALRIDGRGEHPWAATTELIGQLTELLPACVASAPEQLTKLGYLDSLRRLRGPMSPAPHGHASHDSAGLHQLLRDWLLAVARRQCLVIGVDNIDEVDDASAGLLAALASASERHRLLIVATQQRDPVKDSAAREFLADRAQVMALSPLLPEEVEALLGSVFGGAPNLPMVAARIHAHAEGTPQIVMELTQELVDRSLVRYEAGQWLLPERLDPAVLGTTLGEAFEQRLQALSESARELAETLAVGLAEPLPPHSFLELAGWTSAAQLHAALAELTARQVIKREGDHVRFARPGWTSVLVDNLAESRKRAIHERIARHLQAAGADPIAVARHRLAAGQDAAGIEVLFQHLRGTSRWASGPVDYGDVLKRAIAAADGLKRPREERYLLRLELVQVGRNTGVAGLHEHIAWLLEVLGETSGLADWHRLEDVPDATVRLNTALQHARARYDAMPERDRTHTPREAIRALPGLISSIAGIASNTNDMPLLRSLPSLQPFARLSPAIAIIGKLMKAVFATQVGNTLGSLEFYQCVLDEVEQPGRGGLDEQTQARIRNAMVHTMGLAGAKFGRHSAIQSADELAEQPAWRAAAWHIRKTYYLWTGDLARARNCEREACLLQLSTGSRGAMENAWPVAEANCRELAGDVAGLRRCTERIRQISELHRSQLPFVEYFDACYELLRNNVGAALAKVESSRELVEAGEHYAWPLIASKHIELLCQVDPEQALVQGTRYLEDAERIKLGKGAHFIAGWLALGEARTGQPGRGFARFEEILADMESAGCQGVVMGTMYQIRAQVALATSDRDGFDRSRELCRANYNVRGWPALAAKFEKLLDDARALRWNVQGDPCSPAPGRDHDVLASIRREIAEPRSAEARQRCALATLLTYHGAARGYLFGIRGAETALVASTDDSSPEEGLCDLVADYLAAEVAESTMATLTALDCWTGGSTAWKSSSGDRYELVALVTRSDTDLLDYVVGIAALSVDGREFRRPEMTVIHAISEALLTAGDVEAMVAA